MSMNLWIGFSVFALGIILLTWFLIVTSIKVNYTNDYVSELQRSAWNAVADYGSEDYQDTLRQNAKNSNYFIQIIKEDGTRMFSVNNEGVDSEPQQEDIVAGELTQMLDEGKGRTTYFVEDIIHESRWAVNATVTANWDNSREVLVISRSLANVELMLDALNSRFLIVLLLILLIAAIVSTILARSLTRPLEKLTERARQMGEGDYQAVFPDSGCAEVKQLSDTLQMASSEFMVTEQLRRDFIANISHDMKTPLTVIKAYAEMIREISGENPEKRGEHLNMIIAESDKLTAFVQDSMDLAKLQSKAITTDIVQLELGTFLRDILETYRMRMDLANYQFEADIGEELWVNADTKLLYRAVLNLLNNAVKFSEARPYIQVNGLRRDGWIRVEVIDQGGGISADAQDYIWTRFYQAEPYSENKTGMGMGLNIFREIMELLNCHYGVRSQEGEGSCFWFEMQEVEKA